jgi:hypothetical protein
VEVEVVHSPNVNGINGSNSVFSTITSTGGGGGGYIKYNTLYRKSRWFRWRRSGTVPPLQWSIGGSGNTPPTSPPQGQSRW